MEDCQIGQTGGRCCCECTFLVPTWSHPITDGKPINHQIGQACVNPELDGVYVGWAEHGLCESFEDRRSVYTMNALANSYSLEAAMTRANAAYCELARQQRFAEETTKEAYVDLKNRLGDDNGSS